MVATVILGIITPTIHQVAMVPAITQAKNANFQKAELQTLTYMTTSIHREGLVTVPDSCDLTEDSAALQNYTITCEYGSHRKTIAKASRSFTLFDLNGTSTDSASVPVPPNMDYTPGVYCPPWDTNGTISFNSSHNVRCIPTDGSVDNGNMS